MKKKRRHLKTGVAVTGALLGATLTGAALTGATQTRDDNTTRSSAAEFSFVEFTRSQAVHLNASNTTNPPDGDVNPPDPDTPPTCRVLFRLFNSDGQVVATATSMVQPGKTGQLVFANPPDGDMPVRGVRGEIALPPGPCKDVMVGSLEIIDTASGEVKAVVGTAKTVQLAINPPDPDFPGTN
jgi:hypothetical protein